MKKEQQIVVLGDKLHPYQMAREYLREYFDDANCMTTFRYTMKNYFRLWG